MRIRGKDRTRSQSGTVWTDREHQTMLSMLCAGCTRRTIGFAIGRSEDAVSSRIAKLGLAIRHRPRPKPVAVEYPTARIPKQLVVDWYELGWRVLGIGATECVLEWRLGRVPEYPGACKVEMTASRILEDA